MTADEALSHALPPRQVVRELDQNREVLVPVAGTVPSWRQSTTASVVAEVAEARQLPGEGTEDGLRIPHLSAVEPYDEG
ncbi:hypothetical protein [Streptomyces hydrogenans]|uniref:hypothetical protein n=1 Tax=Streptomyces hydrogenans TaxID=1873719 RepID=UPI00342989C8